MIPSRNLKTVSAEQLFDAIEAGAICNDLGPSQNELKTDPQYAPGTGYNPITETFETPEQIVSRKIAEMSARHVEALKDNAKLNARQSMRFAIEKANIITLPCPSRLMTNSLVYLVNTQRF